MTSIKPILKVRVMKIKEIQAFTLVELSIVLVILGLLVGGVLSGQSLIRAAELRAVATERDQFATALHAFQDKYFTLPGDMPNAFSFWGAACGTDATAFDVGCNGDGDGTIEALEHGENLKAWEHLSRAGLVAGSYDGTGLFESNGQISLCAPGLCDPSIPLASIPKSRLAPAMWDMRSNPADTYNVAGTPFIGVATVLGHAVGNGVLAPIPSLTNGEAWNIDRKTDDGYANTGSMRGDVANSECDDHGADAYRVAAIGADTKERCILYFKLR